MATRKLLGTAIENTLHLMETATAGATSVMFPTLNLHSSRRVMPTVIANELVGVQSATGPGPSLRVYTTQVQASGAVAGEEARPKIGASISVIQQMQQMLLHLKVHDPPSIQILKNC